MAAVPGLRVDTGIADFSASLDFLNKPGELDEYTGTTLMLRVGVFTSAVLITPCDANSVCEFCTLALSACFHVDAASVVGAGAAVSGAFSSSLAKGASAEDELDVPP